MDRTKYEFQSEFAKRYFSEGQASGEAKGEAKVVLKLLTLKFGPLSPEVTARVQGASVAELDQWTERVLSATTLDEILR